MGQITMDTSEYDALKKVEEQLSKRVEELNRANEDIKKLHAEKEDLMKNVEKKIVKKVLHIHRRQNPAPISEASLTSIIYETIGHLTKGTSSYGRRFNAENFRYTDANTIAEMCASSINQYVASQSWYNDFKEEEIEGEYEIYEGFEDIEDKLREEVKEQMGAEFTQAKEDLKSLDSIKTQLQDSLKTESGYKETINSLEDQIEDLKVDLEETNLTIKSWDAQIINLGARNRTLIDLVDSWKHKLSDIANYARGISTFNGKASGKKIEEIAMNAVKDWDSKEREREIRMEAQRKAKEELEKSLN